MDTVSDPFPQPGRRHRAWLPWLVLLAFVVVSIAIKAWLPATAGEVGRARPWPTLPWPAAGFVWAMPRLIPVFFPDTSSGLEARPPVRPHWLTPDVTLRLQPVLADMARGVMKGRR